MSISDKYLEDLFTVITNVKSVEECKILFEDLCTYKEVEQMAQRVAAARCLLAGDTYEEVIKKTDISSATLSRVSKCVKYGKGYKTFLGDTDNNAKQN